MPKISIPTIKSDPEQVTAADLESQTNTLKELQATKAELAAVRADLQALKTSPKSETSYEEVLGDVEPVIFVCAQPNSSYVTASIQTVTFTAHSRQIGTNADSTAREVTVGVFKTANARLIKELRALVKKSSAFYEVKTLNDITGLTIGKVSNAMAIEG